MPIRVKCPNASCGKVMNVKDELAGKKGKCPGCGGVLPIPKASAPAPAPAKKKVDDDEEDSSPYEMADKPDPKAAEEEAKKKARKRRSDDDEDDEDGEEEDEDDEERSRKKQRDREKLMLLVSLGLGIVALIGLGIAPLLNWYALTFTGTDSRFNAATMTAPPPPINGWEGKLILGVSGLAALLVGVGLILSLATEEAPGEMVLTITSCLAEGWGVAALIWVLGFTWWWIYVKRIEYQTMAQKALNVEIGAVPDVGLIVAIVTSLLVCLSFSYSLTKRNDLGWCYLSQFLGLIVGALLVGLNVKPW